ncbi:reverse transcriptase domain-containing protein [Tanacetum coccineum]
MILGSLKKFKKRSPEVLKPRSEDTRRASGNTTRNDLFPPFLIIEAQTQVIEQVAARSGMDSKMAELLSFKHNIGISAMVIENKVKTLTITTFLFQPSKSSVPLHSGTIMSSSPHSTVVPSDSDNENTFSSTNILNYFPASPGNISPNSSDDFTKYLLDILLFPPLHDDPYIQAYDVIPPSQVIIALPAIVPPPMSDSQSFFPPNEISSPEGAKTPVESPNPMSTSLLVGSSSSVRSTTSPSDYLSLMGLSSQIMAPKKTSTSATLTMTQAALRQLIADSVAAALEAQAADMANTDNTNKNIGTSRNPNRRQDKKYHGNLPLCTRCTLNHTGICTVKCRTCNKVGHLTRNCKSKGQAMGSNLLLVFVTCHACGEKGHYKSQCSKIDNSTFHVSKKSLCDESLIIPKKEIWLDDKLNYVEESVEIMDREVKQLRRRCIPIVKVRWNSEFTWEREDQIRAKYPHLFSNITLSLN